MNKDKNNKKNDILKFSMTSKFKTKQKQQKTTTTDKMETSAVLICYNNCYTKIL